MFRYKKRLFMTLFGIGGCTALLLTAFGLRDSIGAVVGDQFTEIFHYDMAISLDEEAGADDQERIHTVLESLDGRTEVLRAYSQDISALAENADMDRPLRELTFTSGVSVLIAEDNDALAGMIHLSSPRTFRLLELPDDGVILTVKLADRLKVKAGDTITISEYKGVSGSAVTTKKESKVFVDTVKVKVAAITQNYLGHFIYMSRAYLQTLDHVEADLLKVNSIYVKNESIANPDEADRVARELLNIEDVSQVNLVRAQAATFATAMNTLDSVIVILILAAGLLAILVLYNLNNINISERRREIATLKVLGFNRNELANYIYRENIFLMLIGIVLGLLGGIFLHRYLVSTVEVDLTHFGRIIKPMSWLYSVVLTVFFSFAVNLAMYPKIQKTDMVESLKSIE